MKYIPRKHQVFGVRHILNNPYVGLFMDMGLGKTSTSLTAMNILIKDFDTVKWLVIAPLQVARATWSDEAEEWDHLKHLKITKILGSEKERIAALREESNIYIINRENVSWLVALLGTQWPFEGVVIDESSSFKDSKSNRFRSLKIVRPRIRRMILLTGTPASNGMMDLWAQLYLLDKGERLYDNIKKYRTRYFSPGDGEFPKYMPRKGAKGAIIEKIKDICISMRAEDYLDLPKRITNVVKVHLDPKIKKQYDDFERDEFIALNEMEHITAANAGVMVSKLIQFCNGAVYDENREAHEMHEAKLDMLEEKIEALQGNPVIVFYQFKHDLARCMKRLSYLKPRLLKTKQDLDDWNAGKIPVLFAHALSAGHGLNMQHGGHNIIWFGLPYSLEQFMQANARIDRQGQKKNPVITIIICADTVEEDVLKKLNNKKNTQDDVLNAVKARVLDNYKTLQL